MKCVFIYNPASGKQKNADFCEYVVEELKKIFEIVDVRPTQKGGDAENFAREACGVYDVLVVSGGDGTMNEIINGVAKQEKRPKIGYIPTGTTNDLAHSLKIPKNVKKAIKIIKNGFVTTHDIFKVNNRFGIYVCAFGLFTRSSYSASQKSKKKFGRLAYFQSGAKEIFNSKPFPLEIQFDNVSISGNFVLGVVANSKYVAGYKINKMANCNDGFVNVIFVKTTARKIITPTSVFRVFRAFLFGMHTLKHNKKCIILKLKKFHVSVPKNTTINLDGEAGLKGDFDFEVLPKHVEIFVKEEKSLRK